jgi:hypothetical protein
MDRGSMGWLLAGEGELNAFTASMRLSCIDERVKLPSDATRTVRGVDVLPWVMSPLMGPEEYDMDVRLTDKHIMRG